MWADSHCSGCNFQVQKWGQAWLNLQEAISIGQLLKIEDVRSYSGLHPAEQERRLKAYWLLAVTERAFALQSHHDVHLKGSITRMDSQLAQKIVATERSDYLRRRLFLFDVVDEHLIACYNGRCTPAQCTVFTRAKALAIYRTLSDPSLHANAGHVQELSAHDSHSSIQAADLWISARWLQDKIWNLAFDHGLVEEHALDDVFRSTTPFQLAQAALGTCRLLPIQSLEACGISILEKLFGMIATALKICAVWPHLRAQPHLEDIVRSGLALFTLFRNGRHPFMQRLRTEAASVGIGA
jgi:hypothetical protein